MCSLSRTTGLQRGGLEIARDVHACARFLEPPGCSAGVRRSREMRMHVLAFSNHRAAARGFCYVVVLLRFVTPIVLLRFVTRLVIKGNFLMVVLRSAQRTFTSPGPWPLYSATQVCVFLSEKGRSPTIKGRQHARCCCASMFSHTPTAATGQGGLRRRRRRAASNAGVAANAHGRQRRLFVSFENYLANGSPGKSAAKPVVIYAKNYTLFVRAGSNESQRPSEIKDVDPATGVLVT